MNYKNVKVGVTGANGFLGARIVDALTTLGADVVPIMGDLRDDDTLRFDMNDSSGNMRYLFHFGSPSSQVFYKKNAIYHVEATIGGFVNIAKKCQENGTKLIYPSTGSLSASHMNEYAMCKKVLEDIHINDNLDALGIRLFATYGPGEERKGEYASVITQFAKEMLLGNKPVIYGDGQQKRDFIFVDDAVFNILDKAASTSGIIEIGSGKQHTFNEVVSTINEVIGTNITPEYVDKPQGYLDETVCNNAENLRIVNGLKDGATKTVEHLRTYL